MAPDNRAHAFVVRLSDDEHAMLLALAAADGLSAADVVRQQVRKAHAAAVANGRIPKPKTRKKP